jgi:outer membrane biosynthesis protein TonB
MIIRIGRKYKLSDWLSREIKSDRTIVVTGSSDRSVAFSDDKGGIYKIDKSIFLNHAKELLVHGGRTSTQTVVAPVTPTIPVVPVEPTEPVTPVTPTEPVIPTEPVSPTDPVTPVVPVNPVEPEDPDNPYGGNYV